MVIDEFPWQRLISMPFGEEARFFDVGTQNVVYI
jgi:hypothetical protein